MKMLLAAAAATFCWFALADAPDGEVQVASRTVQEQLSSIELINVTAEKPISEDAEQPDAELARILSEVETLDYSGE